MIKSASEFDPENPRVGVYTDIPFLVYLEIDAFSQSMAKEILISPADLKYYMESKKDTDALRLGKLTDYLLFDPEMARREFVQAPLNYKNDDGETKSWKRRSGSKAAARFGDKLTHDGELIMVSRDDFEHSQRMIQSIQKHRAAMDILSEGMAQVTMIWFDEESGVLCKGRTDWWGEAAITDLKTTKKGFARQSKWDAEIGYWRYDVQAGAYIDARLALTGENVSFQHIVVEKKPPYNVMAYLMGPETQDKGECDWYKACKLYSECKALDKWPGYSDCLEVIEMRSYQLTENMTTEQLLGQGCKYEW